MLTKLLPMTVPAAVICPGFRQIVFVQPPPPAPALIVSVALCPFTLWLSVTLSPPTNTSWFDTRPVVPRVLPCVLMPPVNPPPPPAGTEITTDPPVMPTDATPSPRKIRDEALLV